MARDSDVGPLTQRFNLMQFTDSLIADLEALRAGKISVRDANARALLAKHILRSVHYVVLAQKFLSDSATQIEGPQSTEDKPIA